MPLSNRSSSDSWSYGMGAGSNADGSYASVAGSGRGAADGRLLPRREGPRRRRFDGDEGALCVLKRT